MTRRRARVIVPLAALAVALAIVAVAPMAPRLYAAVVQRLRGRATVEDRLAQFGESARARMAADFERAGVAYPPASVVLLGLKQEKQLHVYAAGSGGQPRLIRSYPVLAASGGPGPKLRRGDRQVPEGVYQIESLNPNSLYHLSLRVSYPNEFDRARAREEGRTDLGGDIMIHGKSASIGCLAMGDPAAEKLFVLAADTGIGNITVILAPADPRTTDPLPAPENAPAWLGALHAMIRAAASELPAPRE